MKIVYLLLLLGTITATTAQKKNYCSDSANTAWMSKIEKRVKPKNVKADEVIRLWQEPYFLTLSPSNKEGYMTLYINQIKERGSQDILKVHTQTIALSGKEVELILLKFSELKVGQLPSDCLIEGYNYYWTDCNAVVIEQKGSNSRKIASFICPGGQTVPEVKRLNQFITFAEELLDKQARIEAFHNSLPKGIYSYGMIIMTKK